MSKRVSQNRPVSGSGKSSKSDPLALRVPKNVRIKGDGALVRDDDAHADWPESRWLWWHYDGEDDE